MDSRCISISQGFYCAHSLVWCFHIDLQHFKMCLISANRGRCAPRPNQVDRVIHCLISGRETSVDIFVCTWSAFNLIWIIVFLNVFCCCFHPLCSLLHISFQTVYYMWLSETVNKDSFFYQHWLIMLCFVLLDLYIIKLLHLKVNGGFRIRPHSTIN